MRIKAQREYLCVNVSEEDEEGKMRGAAAVRWKSSSTLGQTSNATDGT